MLSAFGARIDAALAKLRAFRSWLRSVVAFTWARLKKPSTWWAISAVLLGAAAFDQVQAKFAAVAGIIAAIMQGGKQMKNKGTEE